ncbi:MAG: c-type cytochrome [Oligoflexus sp.]
MKVRDKILLVSSLVTSVFLTACNACTEQHDPRPIQEQLRQESEVANRPQELLSPDGSYPEERAEDASQDVAAAPANPATQKYQLYCAACHGADGKADGPTAQAMNPKPRNLTLASWQDNVDDEHIRTVIKDGGAAVGLSPAMTAWGGMLSEEELNQMVQLVRDFRE